MNDKLIQFLTSVGADADATLLATIVTPHGPPRADQWIVAYAQDFDPSPLRPGDVAAERDISVVAMLWDEPEGRAIVLQDGEWTEDGYPMAEPPYSEETRAAVFRAYCGARVVGLCEIRVEK